MSFTLSRLCFPSWLCEQEALGSASYVFDLLERRPSMQVVDHTLAPPQPTPSALRPARSAFNSTRDLLDPRADIGYDAGEAEEAMLRPSSEGTGQWMRSALPKLCTMQVRSGKQEGGCLSLIPALLYPTSQEL